MTLYTLTMTYLGVVPGRGFLVALNVIKPVTTEYIDHMMKNRIHPNFKQNAIGINHMPRSVTLCDKDISLFFNKW